MLLASAREFVISSRAVKYVGSPGIELSDLFYESHYLGPWNRR
jgi:hypothetical protein